MPGISNRLTGNEIKKILSQGNRQNSQNLALSWVKGGKVYKRAIIVSKRVDNRAVIRNRLRRVISEELRLLGQKLQGFKLVVSLKASATKIDSSQLRNDLKSLLNKSKII